jgi:hypothetical protein
MMEGGTLYVTETECASRLGFSPGTWDRLRVRYERLGMPRKDPISKRRYWPAVRAFFDRHNGTAGGNPAASSEDLGTENLEAFKTKPGRRAGP